MIKYVGSKDDLIAELRRQAQVHREASKGSRDGKTQLGKAEGLEFAVHVLENWEPSPDGQTVPPGDRGGWGDQRDG